MRSLLPRVRGCDGRCCFIAPNCVRAAAISSRDCASAAERGPVAPRPCGRPGGDRAGLRPGRVDRGAARALLLPPGRLPHPGSRPARSTRIRRARASPPRRCRGSDMPVTVRRAAPGLALGLALGLLALGPGLRRGFLLSYDMVFVPREPFTSTMFGLSGGPPRAVPSDFVIAVASRARPADLIQKLVLLLIFVLACSGAAALLHREPLLARLAAGTCYAWNPY